LANILNSTTKYKFGDLIDHWQGYATINGLGLVNEFVEKFGKRLDERYQTILSYIVGNKWLEVRVSIMSNLVIGSWILVSIWTATDINAGLLALIITNGFKLCRQIPYCFNDYTGEFQTTLDVIERLNQYVAMEPESIWKSETEQHPISSCIEFRNVSVRYKPSLPLVLKDLSFKIESGQKIGLIGRTGAGKSTITSALFRLIELESGDILIGDVNIKDLGCRLRQYLTIIPQV
jgi:ABC-type multidrug transport system fused ATPase/permease subunit